MRSKQDEPAIRTYAARGPRPQGWRLAGRYSQIASGTAPHRLHCRPSPWRAPTCGHVLGLPTSSSSHHSSSASAASSSTPRRSFAGKKRNIACADRVESSAPPPPRLDQARQARGEDEKSSDRTRGGRPRPPLNNPSPNPHGDLARRAISFFSTPHQPTGTTGSSALPIGPPANPCRFARDRVLGLVGFRRPHAVPSTRLYQAVTQPAAAPTACSGTPRHAKTRRHGQTARLSTGNWLHCR
ncbi:hypothetical protein CDD83_3758 [Cordyceps sp. RAO-2017]|nr:hypothetical protein CDD83_3758 [Cordyceps sp. RAO-2017]